MLKKTMTYTNYDGVEITEDFYFNLSKAEVTEMELGINGGMSAMLQKIVDAQDVKQIMEVFKNIILKAYGEKSSDGRRFMKSDEISKAFSETEAYSDLYMSLASDAEIATDFIKGILPEVPNAPKIAQG